MTIVLAAITLLAVLTGMAQEPAPIVVKPPSLKWGDTIAVVSPSSTPDSLIVAKGCATLREWGYVPVVGPHALDRYHGFAGTVEERTADLQWALREPSVKAILCSRGGDGAVQVLRHIPLDEFRRHPKWVMGFSDVTAIHSAEVAAGVMSIHCSMCDGIGRDTISTVMQQLLQGQLPAYRVPPHPLNQKGEAIGRLVGGNLSVFCGLAGSDYDFLNRAVVGHASERDENAVVGHASERDNSEGLILFFEDTGEAISKVDRMLHLLEIRGILARLKGIIVGHFSNYKYPENGFADMYDMLHEYLQHYDIPVCYDFPVGHHSGWNPPMVEGCRVQLTIGEEGTSVIFLE